MKKLIGLLTAGLSLCAVANTARAQTWKWARSAGDNNNYDNRGTAVAIDTLHNVYATGTYANGCVYGGTMLNKAGVTGIFITKYDAAGSIIWQRTIDGDGADESGSIALDHAGGVYVTGNIHSRVIHFTTVDSVTNTSYSEGNCFVMKYSAVGVFQWARVMNTPYNAKTTALTVDAAGNVIVGGYFRNYLYLADTSLRGGAQNIFMAKYDSRGDLVWANAAKSDYTCLPGALTTDASGNIYTTGKLSGDIAFTTQAVGTITDQRFNTTSIPAGYNTYMTTASVAYTTGGLITSGGNNTFTNEIYYNYYSNLENFKIRSSAKVLSSGDGLGLGKYAGTYVIANFPMRVGGANRIYLTNYADTVAISGVYSIAIGDSVNIAIERNYDTISAAITNYTQDYTVTTGYRHLVGMPVTNTIMPNNGYYGLVFLGGSQLVTRFSISSTEDRNALCSFTGNSITTGYFSGGKGKRYSDDYYSNNPYQYGVNAGAGDRIAHVLLDTTEMIKINPRYVFINIGVNDAHAGYDTLLFQADYQRLITTYLAHGIQPVAGTLTPQGGTMVMPYDRRIVAMVSLYSLAVADIYTYLADVSTGYMLTAYNSGDNVHPNTAGNARMAQAIYAGAPFLLADSTSWGAAHNVVTLAPGKDKVFTAKYTPAGNLVWVTVDTSASAFASARDNDYTCGNGIAVDKSGNVYAGGNLLDLIYTPGGGAPVISRSAFLYKYNSGGTPVWQKRWGGNERNAVTGVATNGSGLPYVVGDYGGFLTIGGYPLPAADYVDMFVSKFDAAGNPVWVANGAGHATSGYAIAVDQNDSSVITTGGYNNSAKFGALTLTSPLAPTYQNYDIFVAKQVQGVALAATGTLTLPECVVYPNPAGDEVNISFGKPGGYSVNLVSVIGNTLKSVTTSDAVLKIDMSRFANGMYYLSVTDDNNTTATYKFVKMK